MTVAVAERPVQTQDPWLAYDRFRDGLFAEIGYEPHDEQMLIHRDRSRIKQILGGERAGKSFFTAREGLALASFMAANGPKHYWIVGPDYRQARPEFSYLFEDYTALLGQEPKASMPASDNSSWWMRVPKYGIEWETRTSSNVMKLASFTVDGVIMAEAAQQDEAVFRKLRGRVAETRGWIIMVGTLEKGKPWYADLWERWQGANLEGGRSFSLPTWSNTTVFPGGREDPEIKALEATFPPEEFMERFGGVPSKPSGVVFKEFNAETHIPGGIEFEPELPVELAIDPGYAGAYAVCALQEYGNQVHMIDEVYLRFSTAQEVISVCRERNWWGNVPKMTQPRSAYDEGDDMSLPPPLKDETRTFIGTTAGVIDIAGKQHQGLPSHVEIWRQMGGVSLRYQPVSIEDGIHRLRVALKDPGTGEPNLLFADHLSMEKDFDGHPLGALSEFRMYRYREGSDNTNQTDKPVDKYNHAMKALGYWFYDKHGPVKERRINHRRKRRGYWR